MWVAVQTVAQNITADGNPVITTWMQLCPLDYKDLKAKRNGKTGARCGGKRPLL